jgi:hypothetical protein
MQVQLNTDDNIQGRDSLAAWVESGLKDKLSRFREQITRIEVHLSDTNAGRAGDNDKRCKLEARLAGRPPLAVSHDAGTVADALRGSVDKLTRSLDSALGRARDAHGHESIRGEPAD